MSKKLSSDDFGLKLYNRFPPSYRADDVGQNYALRRYLETAADGGFKYIIDEQNGILDLIDPQTAPIEVIHLLYQQYGLDLFHGIPEEFLRAFLPNLGTAWSKKGSLDVVSFIVSSLSGIKTSTTITYDAYGNVIPIVEVKFEMNYNLSNYFPEPKQFYRILEKFIPFYCDAFLIYSYIYVEVGDLHGDDSQITADIVDKKEDLGCISYGIHIGQAPLLNVDGFLLNHNFILNGETSYGVIPEHQLNSDRGLNVDFVLNGADTYLEQYDTDSCEDIIIYSPLRETGFILNSNHSGGFELLNTFERKLNYNFVLNLEVEEITDIVRYSPVVEQSGVSGIDLLLHDRTKQTYEEPASLWARGRMVSNSATLGVAILGEAIFAYDDSFSDVCEDNITCVKAYSISGDIENPVDTFLNTQYNGLNGSFYLSPMTMLDRMTVVGSLNDSFVLNGDYYYNETTEVISVLAPT